MVDADRNGTPLLTKPPIQSLSVGGFPYPWHTRAIMSLTVSSSVKRYATHPYDAIANDIVGKRYDVSLAFVGEAKAKALNQAYRKKDYVPNVLSFPLSDTAGEIIICPKIADREAKLHGYSQSGYQAFLFIHGLLHLKGHDHGDTMEKLEQKFVRRYQIA